MMARRSRSLPRLAATAFALLLAAMPTSLLAAPATITGDIQVWRSLTLDLAGPRSAETADPNPFTDYRLDVTFAREGREYVVPGYFAACGKAAETGCEAGNVWRVHFVPDMAGQWTYRVRFRQGRYAIMGEGGEPVTGFDGRSGSFHVQAAVEGSSDPRDRGRLIYNGTRYLEYAASGELFFKAGADAPENTLAFADFDATPNRGERRKSWSAHIGDAKAADVEAFGWQGRGAGLIGAWSYLHDQGLNAVSFLTFSLGGDDQNVFPHLLRVPVPRYEAMEPAAQWADGVHHTRFDVSKMDQWGRVFAFADARGMFLHFKLQELENDELMDGGEVGIERIAYLRQIIARYGHFLALNWNIGEENTQSIAQEIATIAAIEALDPYDHPRVSHSYPGPKLRYHPLLGEGSRLTGVSMQSQSEDLIDVRPEIAEWVLRSAAADRPWSVASDEQGGGSAGVTIDAAYPSQLLPTPPQYPDNRRAVRGQALWGTLTAGGYGVEYYAGYGSGCGDLLCQDHRTRESKWRDAAIAIAFFRTHVGRDALRMMPLDTNGGTEGAFWFGMPGEKFVVYAHDGNSLRRRAMIANSRYRITWFDPTNGKLAGEREVQTQRRSQWVPLEDEIDTGQAPGDPKSDWVLLIERLGPVVPSATQTAMSD